MTWPDTLYGLLQDLQVQLEEEARVQEQLREEQALLERRCTLLVTDGEESRTGLEAAERARKTLETELQEATERCNDINNQVHLWTKQSKKTWFQKEAKPEAFELFRYLSEYWMKSFILIIKNLV